MRHLFLTRSYSVVVMCLFLLACGAGWRRADLQTGVLKPRQQVQVWRGNTATRLHAVVITSDSVSAVPYWRPIECDTCRVQIARAEVDSMRFGNPVAGFWKTVGLVLAIPAAFWVGGCLEAGATPFCSMGGS
jgi:hypothetical protein